MGFLDRASSLLMVSGQASRSPQTPNESNANSVGGESGQPQPLILALPPEIIQQILSYLSAEHLASLYRTCRDFRPHTTDDKLWLNLLRLEIPPLDLPITPAPFDSYRSLYLAHHPNWFLTRHRIWFSDDAYTGRLILIKYNPHRGSIEGYRLAAERPPAVPQVWSYKPDVLIHHLNPNVYASTSDPLLSLSPPLPDLSGRSSWLPSSEIPMQVGAATQKIDASLLLSINLPEPTASAPSVSVWPPRLIPSMPRTRSSSSSGAADRFTSRKHKPQSLSEISRTTFRLRTWSHFTRGMLSLGVRIGEEISTWSTLSTDHYTPTPDKPYQGIFVGDYAAHGCEFLLVLQNRDAPTFRSWNRRTSQNRDRPSRYLADILAALSDHTIDPADVNLPGPSSFDKDDTAQIAQSRQVVMPNVADPDGQIHKGSIEAVKLTGDVNVPRGEHTFVADDIGPSGTIRIADEAPFTGARIVRSRGHVAGRGFEDDEFIPSQLILINPDLLAQYWVPFGHISFYKRIDIDELSQRAGYDTRRRSG